MSLLLPRIVPCLHPASFAIVMGTGTLACVTLEQAEILPFLYWPGQFFCWLDYLIFCALAPYAVISWSKRKQELRRHLDLPSDMAFFATIGIGLLVLATQTLLYNFPFFIALTFWIAGAVCTIFLNLAIFLRAFLRKLDLEHITPALFIPVVSLLALAASGSSMFEELGVVGEKIIMFLCVASLGAGLMLYMGLFGAMLERHLLLAPLPDHLAPTLWIHLAPIGWGALGVLAVAGKTAPPQTVETLKFFCLLAWGAAFWWVIMALALTVRAIIHRGMYFNMAWWSFIFPLGSFALLSRKLQFVAGAEISFCVWVLMVFIWFLAVFKTLRLAWKDSVCAI